MKSQNGIVFSALVVEPLVALVVTYLAFRIVQTYWHRRKPATLSLAQAVTFSALSVWLTAAGKYLDYFSSVSQDIRSYSDFCIMLAYGLMAIANVFYYNFTEQIFLSDSADRKFVYTILNGLTVGLTLATVSLSGGIYAAATYIVLYHVVLTTALFLLLSVKAFSSSIRAPILKAKVGYRYIGLFAVFQILVFVFFAIDNAILSSTGSGYTFGYYLAWFSAFLSMLFAYMGYVMPSWVLKISKIKEMN